MAAAATQTADESLPQMLSRPPSTIEMAVAAALEGGPAEVIALMKSKRGDANVLCSAIEALASLAAGHPDHRAVVVEESNLAVVVSALRAATWHAQLQGMGCSLLAALASDHAESIGAVGGVELVDKALETCADDFQVALNGLRALGNLCKSCDDNLVRARAAGLDATLEAVLEKFGHDGQIRFRCLGLQERLAAVPAEELERAGQLRMVVQGSWRQMDASAQHAAAAAAASAAAGGGASVAHQVAVALQEGVSTVLEFMNTHQDSVEAQMWCCDAIGTACVASSRDRAVVREAGGVASVVRAMRTHQWEEALQAAGCMALHALAAEEAAALGEAGAFEAIAAGMASCDTAMEVQKRAVSALRAMLRDDANAARAAEAGLVARVQDALDRNPDDATFQWQGAQLLRKLDPSAGAAEAVERRAVERSQSYQQMRIESFRMKKMQLTQEQVAAGKKALEEVTQGATIVEDDDEDAE